MLLLIGLALFLQPGWDIIYQLAAGPNNYNLIFLCNNALILMHAVYWEILEVQNFQGLYLL